jgi:hypothetical protein
VEVTDNVVLGRGATTEDHRLDGLGNSIYFLLPLEAVSLKIRVSLGMISH